MLRASICEHKDNQELQNTTRKSLFQEMITGYSREQLLVPHFCELVSYKYFANVQCPDQPAVRRMVSKGTLAFTAALVYEDLMLQSLK